MSQDISYELFNKTKDRSSYFLWFEKLFFLKL